MLQAHRSGLPVLDEQLVGVGVGLPDGCGVGDALALATIPKLSPKASGHT